jgi:signal transduction histidine kinase
MRRRLITAFVAMAVIIIALYGAPRVFIVAGSIHSSESRDAARTARLVSSVIAERQATAPVDAEFLARLIADDEGINYVTPDGVRIAVGRDADGNDIVATRQVPGGGSVSFIRSAASVAVQVRETVLPLIATGAVLLLVSVIGAVLLARRLSRPFLQVAETARALGRSSVPSEHEPLSIPEAQAIDDALRESAETLERRIRREHEFAANASHQLRTPITAVRLELEDLSLWPETPPAVRDQLAHAVTEIDRLADAITQLLALARGETAGDGASEPLDRMLQDAVSRWSQQAHEAGRSIQLSSPGAVQVAVPAAASQILDVLLHNAIRHGRGKITVSAVQRAEYVAAQVADEGPRPSGNAIFQRRPDQRTATSGEGIGLALSAELAESLGGHLLLDGGETTTFLLILLARG